MASSRMNFCHFIVQEAGITLVDHHTTSEAFIEHMKKEVGDTRNEFILIHCGIFTLQSELSTCLDSYSVTLHKYEKESFE